MADAETSPWWISFFRGPWRTVQRAGFPQATTGTETDFIVETLGLARGERVLDVPCGDGRHSIALASRGFAVTGLDLNPEILTIARAEAAKRTLDIEFREEDMRSFTAASRFDAAICYGGSFGYFDDEDNLEFVRAAHAALGDGGRLLIDTPVAESLFPVFQERDWSWSDESPDAYRILQERTWDLEAGRIHSTWTFMQDKGISSRDISIRIYTCHELYEMMRQAGFRECRFLEAKTGAPFKVGSSRLALVTTK